jgi:dihydroorotate dehydrogenase (NAD+) catalytic subunit
MDLAIDLAGIRLRNPVIAASGTFGYGEEFERFADLADWRDLHQARRRGQSMEIPPRLFPTASGCSTRRS